MRPFTARYVRLNVVSWYGFVATRMELYGCVLGEADDKKKKELMLNQNDLLNTSDSHKLSGVVMTKPLGFKSRGSHNQ